MSLLLQHGTDLNVQYEGSKSLMRSAVEYSTDTLYAFGAAVVRDLLQYNADPTLSVGNGNVLYYAINRGNFKAVYCLLNHPKVQVGVKDNLSLIQHLLMFKNKDGETALHNLVKLLILFGKTHKTHQLDNRKRCLYAVLLSTVDVKTIFNTLEFNAEQKTAINTALIEAENLIEKVKKEFGVFGTEIVHQCVLSSEEERKVFKQENFWVKSKTDRYNEANADKRGKTWPDELSILVAKNLSPQSIHFFQLNRSNNKAPFVSEMSNMRRLTS